MIFSTILDYSWCKLPLFWMGWDGRASEKNNLLLPSFLANLRREKVSLEV